MNFLKRVKTVEIPIKCARNKGSYISAHVLLNLSSELEIRDKMRGLSSILYIFFATSSINSIIQEHTC